MSRNLNLAGNVLLKKQTRQLFCLRNIFSTQRCYSERSDSSDESSSESDNDVSKKSVKEEALNKLKDLLLTMKKSDFSASTSGIQIPKPRAIAKAKFKQEVENSKKKEEEYEKKDVGNRLAQAASDVAKSMGGDAEKTERELLEILLSKKRDPEAKDKEFVTAEEHRGPQKSINLNELISGMKVDTTSSETTVPLEQTRAFQVRKMLAKKLKQDDGKGFYIYRRQQSGGSAQRERVNLFEAAPLGIFDKATLDKEAVEPPSLPTWDAMTLRELRLCVTHPPNNVWEQMIQWTEQGKIWRFPIDNAQDWTEELNTDFTEHVFVEQYLEPWCPTHGPVRHFMELVCVGLSKNPYLSAAEKKETISWYETYFRGKEQVLQETGVPTIQHGESCNETLSITS